MTDQEIIDEIKNAYAKAYLDVSTGKNLELHLKEAKDAISEIGKRIENAKSNGLKTDSWEIIKNRLYELVYIIGEKTP